MADSRLKSLQAGAARAEGQLFILRTSRCGTALYSPHWRDARMRNVIVVAVLMLCGFAMWHPSLREVGVAFVVLWLTLIAGVGRLGIGFVLPPRPASIPDRAEKE